MSFPFSLEESRRLEEQISEKLGEDHFCIVRNSGRKDDGDKHCRPDLIPPNAEEEVAKVLDFGARKYGDDNWMKVENAKTRYLAAARRHLIQFKKGETADPDSKLHPLAHAICSLLFVLELELTDDK
jgi:hypothetical protein